MTIKPILAASIALLSFAPLVQADTNIPAQPLTTANAAGVDQSDFFISQNRRGTFVNFFSRVPLAGHAGLTREMKLLYSVRTSDGINNYYPVVAPRTSPLVRTGAFNVAIGAQVDHLETGYQNGITVPYRTIFRVPGRGLYFTTGGAPALIKPDSTAHPVVDPVLRYPDNSLEDGFAILFGGVFSRQGARPLVSRGSAPTTTLLTDSTRKVIASNPSQFTEASGEVFFVANAAGPNDPVDNEIFETQYVKNAKPSFYAVQRTDYGDDIQQLTGGRAGVYYTSTIPGAAHSTTTVTLDGINYFELYNSEGAKVMDALNFTPTVSDSYAQIAFSSLDSMGRRRYTEYSSSNANTIFPELANVSSVLTTDPKNITSTGDYYYFSAIYNNSYRVIARHFTGGSTLQYVYEASGGGLITQPASNDYEMANVPNGGGIYFNGDVTIGADSYTDVLFFMDSDSGNSVASLVRSSTGDVVTGARHLRGVGGSNIFRLYFSAPINENENSDYAPVVGGVTKDLKRKPWVVNAGL